MSWLPVIALALLSASPCVAERRSTLIEETPRIQEIQRLQAEIQRLKAAPPRPTAPRNARGTQGTPSNASFVRPRPDLRPDPKTNYDAAVAWLIEHRGNSLVPSADSFVWKLVPEAIVIMAVKELKTIDDHVRQRTAELEETP